MGRGSAAAATGGGAVVVGFKSWIRAEFGPRLRGGGLVRRAAVPDSEVGRTTCCCGGEGLVELINPPDKSDSGSELKADNYKAEDFKK